MRLHTAGIGLTVVAAIAGCTDSGSTNKGATSSPEPATTAVSTATSATTVSAPPDRSATTSVAPDYSGGVDGPVMFVPGPRPDVGQEALIEGTLIRDGDCLYVGVPESGSRYAILWPFGTSWDADSNEVITADLTRIPVGSTISTGGGYGSPEQLESLLTDDALFDRADACADGEFRELAHIQHPITVEPATSVGN